MPENYTDYFIEKIIFEMVKSRYTNFKKTIKVRGFSFNYVLKLTIKCTKVNEKKFTRY